MTDIEARLQAAIERSRDANGDLMYLGPPDALLVDALSHIRALSGAVEAMTPHIAKIERAAFINDDMGRVVTGQTEAARALAEIHAAIRSSFKEGADGS